MSTASSINPNMRRYFLELAYKGTAYNGFQIQDTGITIQSVLTDSMNTVFRQAFSLTGSSRTDAGVHAFQNYFHFDTDIGITDKHLYNINAVLPGDIVVKSIREVRSESHCRFDAISRSYRYTIYQYKDPFLSETGWLYPFKLNDSALDEAAALLKAHSDYTSFSKRNTQVKTFLCDIQRAEWIRRDGLLLFEVQSNRFLRGMIRGLVATMLKVGRGNISLSEFRSILDAKDCSKADFSAPAKGLCLTEVAYPSELFLSPLK